MAGVRDFYQAAARNAAAGEPMCCPPCAPEHFGANAYAPEELAGMPRGAVETSMAWGNPVALAALRPGEVVLDLGCGAGLDVLLAARVVGPQGEVIGVDLVEEMLALARKHAEQAALRNVSFVAARVERLPLPDERVDVVLSNGTLTVVEDKGAVFRSAWRVLRPGGRLVCTDFVLRDGLSSELRGLARERAGCLGALAVSEWTGELERVGFLNPAVSLDVQVERDMFLGVLAADR